MSAVALADKVLARGPALQQQVADLPRPVVFTNGVFDILHRGHVTYLEAARRLGGSLVVAVNTDASARQLGKGPDRPLNRELDRALVLAALASVDCVTFFDERTPVELIRELRPDIYVKGGDYDMATLEETQVMQTWGGQSLAIPFLDGFSTTSLVKKIRAPEAGAGRAAVFLDRDGVINVDHGYVSTWDAFEFAPGAVDAMRRLAQAGYALVVVTNQSGIARGMYDEGAFQALTARMREALQAAGVPLAGVYHCPHLPGGSVPRYSVECDCRKPAPGMLLQAARELGLDLQASALVGDKPSDVAAGLAAGVGRTFLVRTCDGRPASASEAVQDGVLAGLPDAVDALLAAAPR